MYSCDSNFKLITKINEMNSKLLVFTYPFEFSTYNNLLYKLFISILISN